MAKKILTQASYDVDNIQSLADQVKGQAVTLKETFDKTGTDARTYNNSTLLVELQSETVNDAGANAIGAEGTFGTDNVADEIKAISAAMVGLELGEIIDGSLTDAKLSNASGQIKDTVSNIETKTDFITVTQAVNLDDMEEDIDTFKEYGDIVAVTATGDILATYADKFLKCSNVITLTVQPNATIAFDIGTEITIFQYGTGKITIAKGSGVDIRSVEDALALDAQYSACTLKKIATDEWVLVGALA